jgi:hypothetical protein
MNLPEALEILNRSDDPWDLLDAAKALAKAPDPNGHQVLAQAVCSASFLGRLDSDADYEGASVDLGLAALMAAVADNGSPSAVAVLEAAGRSPVYLDHPARVDVLIDAWARIRPAPEAAVGFWEAHTALDDGFVERVMLRLAENGSPPALGLVARKLVDTSVPMDHRRYWLRRHAILHRDNPVLLAAFQRMIAGSIEAELRPYVVEILFDYRPKEWYSPHDEPKRLPSRAAASRQALELLRAIGRRALAELTLPPGLDERIAAELRVIDGRLAASGDGG